MKNILVLCEGNICRSPMAQALLADALPRVHVSSAGLGAMVGAPADPLAIQLMEERGLDVRSHRGMQVNGDLCQRADMVLVMESEQRMRIEMLYPLIRGRVFRLGEHAKLDIPDPYQRGEIAFRQSLARIEDGVGHWLQRIRKLI